MLNMFLVKGVLLLLVWVIISIGNLGFIFMILIMGVYIVFVIGDKLVFVLVFLVIFLVNDIDLLGI